MVRSPVWLKPTAMLVIVAVPVPTPPSKVVLFGVVVSTNTVSAAPGAAFVSQFVPENQSPEAAPIQFGVPALAGTIPPMMTAPTSSAATLVEHDSWLRRSFTDGFTIRTLSERIRQG